MHRRKALRFWRTIPMLSTAVVLLASSEVSAQTQPQYVYGSVPITTTTSQVAAYAKNGSTGALSALPASPFPDALAGGALAIDGRGRFLFIVNPSTSNISMFQIDQITGNLTEVKGSPFSTGPIENPQMAPASPNCLATEKSGQFLYVGYRFGNFSGQGAVNEYLIDAVKSQLVPLSGQPSTDIPSSPIGMTTDPKGLHLYVGLGANASNGLQDAGTQVYSIDSLTGQLSPTGLAGNARSSGTSIALDPKGRFFFDGWSATEGAIDSALISPSDGTAITGISTVTLAPGIVPSAMLPESSGNFLYVQEGQSALVYAINQTTGALTQNSAGLPIFSFSSGRAAADPLGPYVYSLQPDGIHGFLVDPTSGSLSEIPGSPFSIGSATQGMLTISGAPVQAASGPVAQFFPSSANFGDVTLGQASNSQLVTLTNTGDQGLALNSLTVGGKNPSDFVTTPNCTTPTILAANATCTISVAFVPTAAGSRQASLIATDNAPGNPQSIPLSGTGAAPQPGVSLMPGSVSFPTTAQGSTSASQIVTLTNAGSAPLHVSSVLLSGANPGDFAMVNGCSGAYPVNATCTISISFSPLGAGQRLASVIITDDAPGSPQSVQLSGTGGALPGTKPAVTLSAKAISFGAVTQGTTAVPQNIMLTNSGSTTLHISSVLLGGTSSSDVSLSDGCNANSYAASAACTLSVAFAPLGLGQRSASITITDDAPDSPQTISITASVNPALTIAPATLGGTTVTVSAGQTANFNLLLTPGVGFSGSASFTCMGAPSAAMCTAPSLQLAGATPVPYTISVSTTGGALIVSPLRWPDPEPPGFWRSPWRIVLPLLGILFLTLLHFGITQGEMKVGSSSRIVCVAALVLLATIHDAGCGGGSISPANAQSTPKIVTPSGTTTLTVTPVVTTSSGTQLPALQPTQLTLIVN